MDEGQGGAQAQAQVTALDWVQHETARAVTQQAPAVDPRLWPQDPLLAQVLARGLVLNLVLALAHVLPSVMVPKVVCPYVWMKPPMQMTSRASVRLAQSRASWNPGWTTDRVTPGRLWRALAIVLQQPPSPP